MMCNDLDLDPYMKRSLSHNTFKGQSTHARVRAITYICIDGLPCAYIQKYLGYQTTCISYFPILDQC